MSNTQNKTSWGTIAAVLGGFALFALIVALAYLPQRPAPITQGAVSPAERAQRLSDLRAKEAKQANSYAWLDQQKGVVQLPIDRAVELTIQEINAKK